MQERRASAAVMHLAEHVARQRCVHHALLQHVSIVHRRHCECGGMQGRGHE